MAGKLTNIRRSAASGFSIGGVDVLLAVPTKENGKNALVYTPGTDDAAGTVALAPGLTDTAVTIVEFEDSGDNVCSFTDNVQFGGNTYPVPTIGFKLAGRSNKLNKVVETLCFKRHSFLLKLRTGEFIAVGVQNGLKATQGNSGNDGTAGNFAGYDFVLTGAETQLSPSITEASFNALLETVTTD